MHDDESSLDYSNTYMDFTIEVSNSGNTFFGVLFLDQDDFDCYKKQVANLCTLEDLCTCLTNIYAEQQFRYQNGILSVTKSQLDIIFSKKALNMKNMAKELLKRQYPMISNIDDWANSVISKASEDA